MPNNKDIELVLLKSTNNQFELDIIKGLLEDNQIPCLIQEKGSGGYLKIITGSSLFGSDILVERSQYEKAMELISSVL
ncbi:MAG: DUF2007 domain-containing protein [Tissierellia bacterium]|nr:DUF2007 domain-containing protein [Tissierellia bacterium]MDD4726319.1 DUF2007 domain-containing protein [Tissierellia bacterium]